MARLIVWKLIRRILSTTQKGYRSRFEGLIPSIERRYRDASNARTCAVLFSIYERATVFGLSWGELRPEALR